MESTTELKAEQAYVDRAYDALAARAERAASLQDSAATRDLRTLYERDERAFAAARRKVVLDLGDLPLCFGRIDLDPAETDPPSWYVGRVHVDDTEGEPLVIDWRAPVAAPFYRATRLEPMGVVRRRHLHCRGSEVRAIDDEVFADDHAAVNGELVGEAALLRALDRRRTGRMGDVAATIQADQDRIVRAPLAGALVVQGGPGTGKTVVALHRLAYLLYTHRSELEAKGVLVVGPNTSFIRYIERVLPALDEKGATYRTLAALRPTKPVGTTESFVVTAIKGDARMAMVMARAVAGRQRALRRSVTVAVGAYELRLAPKRSTRIVTEAKAIPGTHNERRAFVERRVLAALFKGYLAAHERARVAGLQPGTPWERPAFDRAARATADVRTLFDRVWPELTAEDVLADLWRFPALLREAAAEDLTEGEMEALGEAAAEHGDRAIGSEVRSWTTADVALLDELDGWLGPKIRAERKKKTTEDLDWFADRVIEGVAADADVSMSASMAAEIRERIAADQVGRNEPTRASTVTRTFGHIVVDEAQDVSPMQWRMLARRCPSGSFTIVGDQGQASVGWTASWDDVLTSVGSPVAPNAVVELTVNYRTPAEIMAYAALALRAAVPNLEPPTSVRSTGRGPEFVACAVNEMASKAAGVAREFCATSASGTVAIIATDDFLLALRTALDADPSTKSTGRDPIDEAVALLTPTGAKGLEFDNVIVVEPAAIASAGTAGMLALYVALSRTTDRLVVVHAEPLPPPLTTVGPVG